MQVNNILILPIVYTYMNKGLSVKVNGVHIDLISHTNEIKVHLLCLIHHQTFQIAKHKTIDSVHFVALLKVLVCLKGVLISRIRTICIDVLVQVPALILVKDGKHQRKFSIDIFSFICIRQRILL